MNGSSFIDGILPCKRHVKAFSPFILIIKYDLNSLEKPFCELFSTEASCFSLTFFFWDGKYPRSFMCYNKMFIQWFQASKCPHSVVLLWLAPIIILLCMNALYLPLALGSLTLFRQRWEKETGLFSQCVHWTRWQWFTACLRKSQKSGDSVDCIHKTTGLALCNALC